MATLNLELNKDKLWGNAAMLLCAVLFGVNIPITKTLVTFSVNPLGLTTMRMAFAAIGFWITSWFMKGERIEKRDFFKMMIAAFFGMFFNQVNFIYGLSQTSPIDAGIIATSTPIITMLIASFFLSEPITLKKFGGVFLGAVGALMIIFLQNVDSAGSVSSVRGNLFCFVSACSYAVYLVYSATFVKKYSPVTLMKWMFLFATLYSLPFTYHDLTTSKIFLQPLPVSEYAQLFFTLFGATYLTYMLIPFAQKRIRPTTISTYNYVQPLVASIVAILIGQDIMNGGKVLAGLLIMVGVYFVTTSKSKADVEKDRKPNEIK